MFYKTADQVYRVQAWEEFEWLVHGFGTRHAMTLAGEHPPNLATLRQIHSARVIDASGRAGTLGEADALIDDAPNSLLGVKTADCLPILLVDPERRAVASVHAGWRGTAQHIVPRTVEKMVRTFGSTPKYLHAAIGPGIGKCCFEVGPEVALELTGLEERTNIDLGEINRLQLLDVGLSALRIYPAGLCTVCHPQDFFSYRRDRQQAGRMISWIGLKHFGRERTPAPEDLPD